MKNPKFRLKWSQQSQILLEKLNIDQKELEEIEKYIEEKFFTVGTQFLIDFIQYKKYLKIKEAKEEQAKIKK